MDVSYSELSEDEIDALESSNEKDSK